MNFIHMLRDATLFYQKNQPQIKIDSEYSKTINQLANNKQVVSFDIFDTILTRLFEYPVDLFAYVEGCLENSGIDFPNFAQERVNAEKYAREIAWNHHKYEEVTYDDIYNYLISHFPKKENELNKIKQLELKAELDSIVPSVDHLDLIPKLKAVNKKIIFVSDMYLPKEFLVELLKKNQLDFYDDLFVSSDLLATKHSGKIWNEVSKKYALNSLLHIGDNQHADGLVPKKYCIETYNYKRLLADRNFRGNLSPHLIPFSLMRKLQNLTRDNDKAYSEENFWSDLGDTLGAILIKSFCDWLLDQVENDGIEHIYFCARDAQIIQKAWSALGYDQKCNVAYSYLYVSRKSLLFPMCYDEWLTDGAFSEESLIFLTESSIFELNSYQEYFNIFGITMNDLKNTVFMSRIKSLQCKPEWTDIPMLKDAIRDELTPLFVSKMKSSYDQTIGYLKQEGILGSKKIAMVDVGWNGTLQSAIVQLRKGQGYDGRMHGYYYGLFNRTVPGKLYKNGVMKSLLFNMFVAGKEAEFELLNSINILENLHSGDHGSVEGYYLKEKYLPKLKETINEDYTDKYIHFQQAVLAQLENIKNTDKCFGLSINNINLYSARAAMLEVSLAPCTQERKFLGGIRHSAHYNHADMNSLINTTIPKTYSEALNLYYESGWRIGLFFYWKFDCMNLISWAIVEEMYQTHYQYDLPNSVKKLLGYL